MTGCSKEYLVVTRANIRWAEARKWRGVLAAPADHGLEHLLAENAGQTAINAHGSGPGSAKSVGLAAMVPSLPWRSTTPGVVRTVWLRQTGLE